MASNNEFGGYDPRYGGDPHQPPAEQYYGEQEGYYDDRGQGQHLDPQYDPRYADPNQQYDPSNIQYSDVQYAHGGDPHDPNGGGYYGDGGYGNVGLEHPHDTRPGIPSGDSQGNSFFDGDPSVGYESAPDISFLNQYCASATPPRDNSDEARIEADASWEPVREWLRNHSADEVRAAVEWRDDGAKTALHFACHNAPPPDVIDVFLSIAVDVVRWPDSFGWLPIHYACAYGADTEVIKSLAEAFPESKTTVDRKGRTPLHFALGTSNANSTAVVVLLSSTGAASYPDDNGMLPLHYACAYGASEEALYVLTDHFPDAITTMDSRDRTPLHFALSNAGQKAAPAAVRLLLSLNKDLVNSVDGSPLPLRVLAEYAGSGKKDGIERESIRRCLEFLLASHPDPTADFFTALQSLPDFLQERAVVMAAVQTLLNDKIAQRFPTAILLLDFYAQVMVIVAYSTLVIDSVDRRFQGEDKIITGGWVIALYIGASYFLLREVIQVLSLLSLKSFHIWVYDPSNWLNVAYIVVVYFWTFQMNLGSGKNEAFRTGAALCVSFLWLKLMAYLRNMLIDFAVFVRGVFYVVYRLLAFLLSLIIILVAFSRMFFTIFQQRDSYCTVQPNVVLLTKEERLANLQCEENEIRVFCGGWSSFFRVYTMLLGEVAEDDFADSNVALALFIVFMFLVVILLANVLIAIVTDSYKVIQDQRAAVVFWTNRLDFIAQMDAIANGPWKSRLKRSMGMNTEEYSARTEVTFGKEFWKRLMDLFEDDIDDNVVSFEFLIYTVLRLSTALFIMPCWILLGLITAGWLWPPQVREAVFTSSVFKHTTETEKEDELRKTQVKKLEQEVVALKDDLLQELAIDRTQVVQMKSLVAERKLEIQSEMRHIKRIVTMLFEQQSSL